MNEPTIAAAPGPESSLAPEVAAPRAGALLAAARSAQGLTVVDVARQLRLSPVQVEAIEADDYSKLPGPVFARGFVRNYARLVNLDPVALLGESAAQRAPQELAGPQVPPALGAAFPARHGPAWGRYAVVGAIAVVVAIGWQLWRDRELEIATPPAQPVVVEIAPTPVPAVPETPAEAAAPTDAAAAPAGSAAATATAPAGRTLVFRFTDECWVEVTDREGNKLLSEIQRRGSEARVTAPGPLSVVIGNAAVARVTLDEQPFDLAPHVKVNVARFTVE